MIPLSAIRDSFGGAIPSLVATADTYGMPSICYLSHVYYVDDRHVALTSPHVRRSVMNEFVAVTLVDGVTGRHHLLDLSFDRSETDGDIFARVIRHLSLLQRGVNRDMMPGAIDIYRVEDCRPIPVARPLKLSPASRPAGATIRRSHRKSPGHRPSP